MGPGAIAFYNGFHEDQDAGFGAPGLLGRVKLCIETSSAPLDSSDAIHLTDEDVEDVEMVREYTRVEIQSSAGKVRPPPRVVMSCKRMWRMLALVGERAAVSLQSFVFSTNPLLRDWVSTAEKGKERRMGKRSWRSRKGEQEKGQA